MRPNEKRYVTAVTVVSDFGQRTVYLYTDSIVGIEEWDHGMRILEKDGLVTHMFVPYNTLVDIQFDVEDPNNAA